MKYRIFSFADLYGGQWLVIRMRDLRIVHAAPPRSIWELRQIERVQKEAGS